MLVVTLLILLLVALPCHLVYIPAHVLKESLPFHAIRIISVLLVSFDLSHLRS